MPKSTNKSSSKTVKNTESSSPEQSKPLKKTAPVPSIEIDLAKLHPQTFFDEFVAFIKAFGVIGLALGVVIGGAVNQLVTSLTTNVITPLVGLIFQSDAFIDYTWGAVRIGAFLDTLINFLIQVFVIWLAVKLILARFLTEAEREKIGIR